MAQFIWTEKQDIGPAPRSSHAMAFDSARNRTVLFGGSDANGKAVADTWTWNGAFWTQAADTGPAARLAHSMAFDPLRKRVVLFGGAATPAFGDTWSWDGAYWSQVADTGPAARSAAAMAFDPNLGRVILFGGEGADGKLLADTWSWDGADWTQIGDTGPSPRGAPAMAYAREPGLILLVGGLDASGNGHSDTWSFDGANWTQIADMGPGPVFDSVLADTAGGAILFGGAASSAGNGLVGGGSTWIYSQSTWTQVQDIGPPRRARAACAFDEPRGAVVLFGGFPTIAKAEDAGPPVGAAFGDTWELPVDAAEPAGPLLMASVDLSAPPTLARRSGATLEAVVILNSGNHATEVPITAQILSEADTTVSIPPEIMSVSPLVIPPFATRGVLTITQQLADFTTEPTGGFILRVILNPGDWMDVHFSA